MKKLFALMLCIVLTLALVACGEETKTTEPTTEAPTTTEPTTEAPTTEEPTTEMPTEEITEEEPIEEMGFMFECVTVDAEGMMNLVEQPSDEMLFAQDLYEGLTNEQVPGYFIVYELNADIFESFTFIPYIDGVSAVACEAAMGSIPHSVVVLNLPEGSDVEAIRAQIEANANPRKWICVEAEQVSVVANGNTILLAMATPEACDAIVANFNAKLAG